MDNKLKKLTNPQNSIWLTDKFYDSSSLFNLGGTLLIHQKVDFDILERAINLFIQKNEGMRLAFKLHAEKTYQYIQDYSYKKLAIYTVNSEEELHSLEENFIHTKFNISKGFLYEFKLIKLKNGHGGFNITLHHLITDAWSISLLVSEIIDIYSKLIKKEAISEELNPSYIEYIESEENYLNSEKFKKDAQFWEDVFNRCPTCVSFSQKNSQDISHEAKRKIFSLGNSEQINEFCKNNNISVFTFFMTVVAFYLHRITGSQDVVIGSPILNRNGAKEKKMIGLFINTLPVKIEISDNNISFSELVRHVSEKQFSMFRHHKYPYSNILEYVRKKYKFSNSLYDTIVSYQNARNNSQTSDIEYSTNWDFNGSTFNSLDIHLYDMDNTGILNVFYDYRLDKFEDDEIIDIHNRLLHIMEQVMVNFSIPLKNIEIVTNIEKENLLYKFNDTKLDYPKDKTINELFEEQCKRTPNKVAIAFGNSTLTYKELNERANQLAYFLRNKKGITSNSFVGILTKRSLEMAIGLLAILKSGATYVPIDPEYPEDRISYMLEDSGAKIILVDNYTKDIYNYADTVNICLSGEIYKIYPTDNLETVNTPENLIYLIYTSGSTGKPKGVMLMHKNVNNYIHGLKDVIDFSEDKVIVSVTTICFDIFVTEFWGGLLSGMTVVIANEQEQNIASDLNKICKNYNVNMIQTTPSRFNALISEDSSFLDNITDLMVGGESLPKKLLNKLNNFPLITVFNMYGPTETAVWSTIKKSPCENNITIGKPIANTQVYVLDDNCNLLPPNIPGNLYIGGDGVCKGYYNRPDLNEKVFIHSPFDNNSILYNTNDLAYMQKDGELVHLGRSDFQAKIHGFRVELGEIENAIMNYPNINNVVVLLQDDSLNAYIVSDKTIDTKDLLNYLMKLLPHYMLPKTVTQIEEIPLTPNGKINRKSDIFKAVKQVSKNKVQPRNENERLLYTLIKETVNLDLGVTDNIFEFGMDSLMVIKLVSKLYLYKINLSIQDFYNNPSIEALAKMITDKNSKNSKIIDNTKHVIHISDITKKVNSDINIEPKDILLTGVTGFLGIHVLESLINNSDCNIYCLIRSKEHKTSTTRLIDRLNYYFDGKYNNLIDKRIFVLNSNITDECLGLSKDEYNKLGCTVSSVIHCAADVKHYGNYKLSEKANIDATDNIIKFCLDFNVVLNHISTMTVSGYGLVNVNYDGIFDENDFYIHQNYEDNIYVKTKFIAEEEIFKASNNGLIANIYRIGNLTNRFSDCKFQYNSNENSFINKLKSIKNLGILPVGMKDYQLELTPVDVCANAITKLAINKKIENNVNIYHLYNNNYVSMNLITNILNLNGVKVSYLDSNEFENIVANSLASSKGIPGFIDQLGNAKIPDSYDTIFSNSKTLNVLSDLNFSWPVITKDYISTIIKKI